MPPEAVTVIVSRNGPQPLDARPSTLEVLAGDRFGIAIENEGSSAHVHCRISGELGAYLSIDQPNQYVEANSSAYVSLRAPDIDRELSGTLEVSTGYGARTVSVTLTVTTVPDEIEVDETLGIPASNTTGSGAGGRVAKPSSSGSSGSAGARGRSRSRSRSRAGRAGLDRTTLAVAIVGAAAVLVAVGSAAVVGGTGGLVAVLAVVLAVALAGWLVYTE